MISESRVQICDFRSFELSMKLNAILMPVQNLDNTVIYNIRDY